MTTEIQKEAPIGTNAAAIEAITTILNRRTGKMLSSHAMADILGEIGTAIYASTGVAKRVSVDGLSWTRPLVV